MSPAPPYRYTAGEHVLCTNTRGGRGGLPCTHYVCVVPQGAVFTARPIRSNLDASSDSVPIQCKHCKQITAVTPQRATVAA